MRKTPVVLGVLSIVFGALVSLYSVFGLLSQRYLRDFSGELMAMQPRRAGAPDPTELMNRMTQATDQLRPVTYTISGGMVALSLVLIVVGIGLYRRQPWARPAALLWALAALAFIPVQIYLQVAIVQPRMMEVMAGAGSGSTTALATSMMGSMKGVVAVMTMFFYAPFPVLLLVLMGRASAKNDLVG